MPTKTPSQEVETKINDINDTKVNQLEDNIIELTNDIKNASLYMFIWKRIKYTYKTNIKTNKYISLSENTRLLNENINIEKMIYKKFIKYKAL